MEKVCISVDVVPLVELLGIVVESAFTVEQPSPSKVISFHNHGNSLAIAASDKPQVVEMTISDETLLPRAVGVDERLFYALLKCESRQAQITFDFRNSLIHAAGEEIPMLSGNTWVPRVCIDKVVLGCPKRLIADFMVDIKVLYDVVSSVHSPSMAAEPQPISLLFDREHVDSVVWEGEMLTSRLPLASELRRPTGIYTSPITFDASLFVPALQALTIISGEDRLWRMSIFSWTPINRPALRCFYLHMQHKRQSIHYALAARKPQ